MTNKVNHDITEMSCFIGHLTLQVIQFCRSYTDALGHPTDVSVTHVSLFVYYLTRDGRFGIRVGQICQSDPLWAKSGHPVVYRVSLNTFLTVKIYMNYAKKWTYCI